MPVSEMYPSRTFGRSLGNATIVYLALTGHLAPIAQWIEQLPPKE
jgi:hypothetical protein